MPQFTVQIVTILCNLQKTLYVPPYNQCLGVFSCEKIPEEVDFCLDHGANPNLGAFARVWSALASVADSSASLKAVEKLLDAEARIEENDALHAAAEKGRVVVVRSLLGKGANINVMGFEYCAMDHKSGRGRRCAALAVDAGSLEVIRLLLDHGGDVNMKDVKGGNVVERDREKATRDVVGILDGSGT
ncbi:MAG: hypothetical protein Q9164_002211 [Protoblastenia rupestris]